MSADPSDSLSRHSSIWLFLWLIITLLVPLSLLLAYLLRGAAGPDFLAQNGPGSVMPLTMICAGLAWLLLGLVVSGLRFGFANRHNAVTWTAFCAVMLLYLNALRERTYYGDWHDYYLAATNLLRGEHLHPRYLYPPLWATLLSPLAGLGDDAVFYACWLANVAGIALLFILLHRVLQKYGFSNRLAAIVAAGFLLVNVPVLRTLFYTQVNLHVVNMILLSLVLYPRNRLLSALALAVAVQLKASPVILVAAFLLERDWRWLGWFVLSSLALAGVTVISYGITPLGDWVSNASHIYSANLPAFRDNSFDSFIRAIFGFFTGDTASPVVGYLSIVLKLILAAAGAIVVRVSLKGRTGMPEGQLLMTSSCPLLILMTLLSPLVWEHHAVFLALPFLVLLKRLNNSTEWAIFGFAYFLEFLLPTFDFFPWSYGRLLAPLAILWLTYAVARRAPSTGAIEPIEQWLEEMPPGRQSV